MTGQLKQIGFRDAGAASLIPSFASFRIWFIHPLIQSNFKGTCRRRSVYPLRFMKHLLLLPYILIASKVTCLSCIPASPITRNLQGHRKRPGSPFGAWSLCCHVVKGSCSSGGRISLSGCDMSLIYCFEWADGWTWSWEKRRREWRLQFLQPESTLVWAVRSLERTASLGMRFPPKRRKGSVWIPANSM